MHRTSDQVTLSAMQNPDNLRVTAESRALAVAVYRATAQLPADERFGLSAQMRRAVVSIGSNIAEGCGRFGNRELVQFLQVSLASTTELEFQAQLAIELELIRGEDAIALPQHIGQLKGMLIRLIKSHRSPKAAVARRP
jgi:four helix bundle protein